ncbi:site-specific integrase [Clostridium sp. MSJ-8]|nr:site-specific integrase [Clostridium sp. MSJ-8]
MIVMLLLILLCHFTTFNISSNILTDSVKNSLIAFHDSGLLTITENIDLDNKTLTVEHTLIYKEKVGFVLGTPKTKSSYRTIKIGDTLVNILKKHRIWQKTNKLEYGQYYKDSNYVCTKENGEQITTNSIKYLSRVVNYELKINFNFHSLKHTHATMLLEAGANPKDIQKRLGHSKISTTLDTYSHVTKKMENETVNIFESVICHQGK